MTTVFTFFRNVHTLFHSGCTVFHLHSWYTKDHVHIFLNTCYFFYILMPAILIGMRCHLTVVLICISLKIQDVEHIFIYLCAICMCSLGFPGWLSGKKIHLPIQKTWVRSLDQEEPLQEGMATHSNILAWNISRILEPGGLQSMGLQKSWTRLSD